MSIFKVKKSLLVLLMSFIMMFTVSIGTVSAQVNGLNGIGAPENTQDQQDTSVPTTEPTQGQEVSPTQEPTGADAMGAIFDSIGVDQEASQKANEYTRPIAEVANVFFAFILGLAFIVMFVLTGVDLLYIAFPPIRKLLFKGAPQQSGGGMGMGGGFGGGYGGGFGGGFGGMGMGGGQPQQSGFSSIVSQLISDEAVAAVQEGQAQSSGGGGMGMMGGFGGMGMMGGGAQQPQSSKSIIISYLKKRTMFVIAFGVCAALFSTTIFTDIGVSLGTWLLNILMGVKDSIPQ